MLERPPRTPCGHRASTLNEHLARTSYIQPRGHACLAERKEDGIATTVMATLGQDLIQTHCGNGKGWAWSIPPRVRLAMFVDLGAAHGDFFWDRLGGFYDKIKVFQTRCWLRNIVSFSCLTSTAMSWSHLWHPPKNQTAGLCQVDCQTLNHKTTFPLSRDSRVIPRSEHLNNYLSCRMTMSPHRNSLSHLP
ncbi:hypothetical protein RRG08_011970 [Elysia crispata]|uniref:Uncharacterized protein n=1 Tax=Elysia crispata TaxID=231223 RepID=A0AAE0ZH98_9GAST|nr:hypothetical protein RRG08_011970 [Elysia crispata]